MLPSDARELVSRYEREKAAIKTAAAGQVRERRQQLIEELKPWQDKYTREAKLDEAVAIRDLIRALTPPVVSNLPDSGSLLKHNSRVGDVFYLCVTGRVDGSVWGTDVYTSDSTLATAAVHAGVLQPGQAGVVKVTILPGQGAYQGSTRNSVRSVSYGLIRAATRSNLPMVKTVEFFYAPKETDAQATSSSGEQDPEVAQLRGLGATDRQRRARELVAGWQTDCRGQDAVRLGYCRRRGHGSRLRRSDVWARPVFVLDSEVGSVRDLIADGKDPAWSPDGRWIAFTREVGGGAGTTEEIWLTAADRVVLGKLAVGSRRRLGAGVMATWSADATTVFFSNPQTREIFSVRVDQPNAEAAVMWKAIGDRFPDLWYPVVAPNGRYVAYHADGQLKIADMTSQKIEGTWPLDSWRGFLGGWTPDGGGLGYGAFGGEDKGLWELPVIIEGKPVLAQPHQILSGSCTLPSWSPTAQRWPSIFARRRGATKSGWWTSNGRPWQTRPLLRRATMIRCVIRPSLRRSTTCRGADSASAPWWSMPVWAWIRGRMPSLSRAALKTHKTFKSYSNSSTLARGRCGSAPTPKAAQTQALARKYERLSIGELEHAIAKLQNDLTLRRTKPAKHAPPINKPRMTARRRPVMRRWLPCCRP